jgi:hypothetical protein
MVGSSTNKLTAAGFDRADKKAITFNTAKFSLVGGGIHLPRHCIHVVPIARMIVFVDTGTGDGSGVNDGGSGDSCLRCCGNGQRRLLRCLQPTEDQKMSRILWRSPFRQKLEVL